MSRIDSAEDCLRLSTLIAICFLIQLCLTGAPLMLSLTRFSPTSQDDWNNKEIGCVYAGDVPYASAETFQFINEADRLDYTWRFWVGEEWWQGNVGEHWFEHPYDNYEYRVDHVDVLYFCGHGSPRTIWFKYNKDPQGDYPRRVVPWEASWGDKDLEWIIFQSCQTLREDVCNSWKQVFDGLHGILGFHSIAYAYPYGSQGWEYARWACGTALGAGEAWQVATRIVQPDGVWAASYTAVIRIDTFTADYYYERLGYPWSDYNGWYYLYGFSYRRWQCTG